MKLQTASSVDSPTSESPVATPKCSSSNGVVRFGFRSKTTQDASEALLQIRSENLKFLPDIKTEDIWKRQPPDFRYIVYEPTPPKRNTADSMRPWEYGTLSEQREIINIKKINTPLPVIGNPKSREADIITRFHIDRPFTAKKKFVSQGMYKPDSYENPRPHDFRQYPPIQSLGLEEFATDFQKDPYSLKFMSQRLNQIHGLTSVPTERNLMKGRQMAPPVAGKDKWERRLILDKADWPARSAAYTRHRRRNRQPYSAFMELVERDLTARWSKEKLEKLLQSCP